MSAYDDLEADLDPEHLVPGDLPGIDAGALDGGVFADQLADFRKGINYIELNGQNWTGQAADVYEAVKDTHLHGMANAVTAFDNASSALAEYAGAMRDARHLASVARDDYRKAKAAATAAWNKAVETGDYAGLVKKPAEPLTLHDLLTKPNPLHSPIEAAVTKLEQARSDLKAAGVRAARRISEAGDLSPANADTIPKLVPSHPIGAGGMPTDDDLTKIPGELFHGFGHLLSGTVLGLGSAGNSTSITSKKAAGAAATDEFGASARDIGPAAIILGDGVLGVAGLGGTSVSRIASTVERRLFAETIEVQAMEKTPFEKALENGQWEPVNEHMSDASRDYQEQITGHRGEAFVVNGVRFDGHNDHALLDAKGDYDHLIDDDGDFHEWASQAGKGADKILHQADIQTRAANGTPIEWFCSHKKTADAFADLLKQNGYSIKVIYHPPQ